jgi:cell division protein FtsQ
VTVAEQRRRINREARRKKLFSINMRALVVIGVTVALALLLFGIYHSPLFTITHIQVEGSKRLTNEHLRDVADIPGGMTLLRVDADGVIARLRGDVWVENATVERRFPSTLLVTVQEREPAAVVEILPDAVSGSPAKWLVSGDGRWLARVSEANAYVRIHENEVAVLTRITDISSATKPIIGEQVADEGVLNALGILNNLSSEMRGLVTSISAPDRAKTTLMLVNNVRVAFGDAKDVAAKEDAIKTIINQYSDIVVSINVRVPDRPTWQGSGSQPSGAQ